MFRLESRALSVSAGLRNLFRRLSFHNRQAPTYEDFLEELVRLGLYGRAFGPEEYASALGHYLGVSIHLTICRDSQHPEIHRNLVREGKIAALQYSPDRAEAMVWLLDSVSAVTLGAAVYHELGHLAAGHPLQAFSAAVNDGGRGAHCSRLARGEPTPDPQLQEAEADLRARYCFAAGILGERLFVRQRILAEME